MNGTALMHLNDTYDAAGNVLSINSENYTYDYLSRIASSAGQWGTTSYAYDGAGNMLSYTINGATTYFSYGPGHSPQASKSTPRRYFWVMILP